LAELNSPTYTEDRIAKTPLCSTATRYSKPTRADSKQHTANVEGSAV
jgi:hypothetical protein